MTAQARTEGEQAREDMARLGVADAALAAAIALTDEERAALDGLLDAIERADESARKARTRASALRRQLEASRNAIKASRVDALLRSGGDGR